MTLGVEGLSFIPTGATTKRGLADWASDNFLNVKNFGAVGDGTTDDTTAIQACFDAAFGTAGSPHGVNSYLNKRVYFPPGQYRAHDLLLTQVKGGTIFGCGSSVSTIQHYGSISAGSTVLKTNGCENTRFQGLGFLGQSGPTATIICIDLDWTGTPSAVGLKNNSFYEIGLGNCVGGVRIAESGLEGYGNYFQHVTAGNGTYGFKQKSTGSNTFMICAPTENNAGGGGTISSPVGPYGSGFWGVTGSMVIINPGLAGLQTDIKWESPGKLLLCGARSESINFLEITNGSALLLTCVYDLSASLSASWKRFVNMTSPAVVVMDGCLGAYDSRIIGTGTLYIRGGTQMRTGPDTPITNYLSGFSGQVRELMVTAPFPFADRPTNPAEGVEVVITDAHTATGAWGETVSNSGGVTVGHAKMRWNGSAWTLVGK
jgi:hypothetical protein